MPGNSLTDMTKVREGLRRFAQGFTPGQKAVTIFAVLAAVVGGYLVMSVTGKPTYAALFTGLQPTDAASITSKLVTDKVPYKLADGGTTIEVPASDVNQERLTLAQAGLPAGGTVGLSLLDKEGITASNMTQQADYLQAIQGELETTIDSIQGVSSSQVNIALPANQDFALNNDNPTGASVMVTMLDGQTLSNGSVQAIVHLVGSSVPNLDSGHVTVADSNGNLLAGPGMSASGASDGDTSAYDASLQAKVQDYLSAVLGPNNSDVQVNATLNYDQVNTNTQSIIPAAKGASAGFCTQTSGTKETYNGSGTPPGGLAGTLSTTATTVAPAAGSTTSGTTGTGSYVSTQNTATCETNQETKTVQQAAGTVTNQSVAVLINSTSLPAGVKLASLKQGVTAAAGIVTARGDSLAFSSMPFNSTAAQQAAKAAAAAAAQTKKQATGSLERTAAVVLIVVLVLFLLWRSARKARKNAVPLQLNSAALALLQGPPREAVTSIQPAIAMPKKPTAEVAALAAFIDNQPDDVADLLRSWMGEKKEMASS